MSGGEIHLLIEKAQRSLVVARDILQHGHADFAASRAYYAMFYVAEALLFSLGQSYVKHSSVISAFGREFSKKGIIDAKFHRMLIDAQDLRNVGDYGVQTHIPAEHVEEVCSWAEEFISAAIVYLDREEK